MEKHSQTIEEKEFSNDNVVEGKEIAIIAYLTIIGLIIAFIMNKDKHYDFASYHIKQVLGLAVIGLIVFVIGQIPILGWIISILVFIPLLIIWIMGLMNAINGKKKPIPLIGKYALDWFKNVDV